MKLALALASLVLVPLFAFPSSPARQGPTLADLAWMSGHWASDQEDGPRVEEFWLEPAGGLALGMNRTVPESGRAAFEDLRIEARGEELVYVASPGGKGTTEFPLVDFGEDFVVFENPERDFAQRIRYELDATGALHAIVSGVVSGEEQGAEWVWKRR